MRSIFSLIILIIYSFSGFAQSNQSPITISLRQFQVPVLKNKDINPVMEIEIKVFDSTKDFSVKEIVFTGRGTTDFTDIENASVFYYRNLQNINSPVVPINAQKFGTALKPEKIMVFKGNQTLRYGTNYFCFSYKLNDNANISNVVGAACLKITTNFGSAGIELSEKAFAQPIGIALRKHKDDNVHTYRIPGLVTTNRGTLIASYDVRRESERDLQGNIDIGISRSTDGGATWGKMQTVMDMKKWGGLPEKFNGVSDACLLVDKNSDNIFLAGLWMHGVLDSSGKWIENLSDTVAQWNHQWNGKGSYKGFDPKETAQFLISRSSDDGISWSEPVNITKMCKKENWWLFAPAPGNGITMKNGTLVIPTQGRDSAGVPFSNITYSTDGGKTWFTSAPAQIHTTECTVAEIDSNILLLNMRDNRNINNSSDDNGRAVALTKDMGKTWITATDYNLIEPACMASLLKHEFTDKGERKSILLFSNPNSKTERNNLTIKVSFNNGLNWPENYWLLLDERTGRGYSSMTSIDENNIGILYEGSQADLVFQKISLYEILQKTE